MQDVQNLKDTFYRVLQDRIANGNPARTVVIRGTVRPGVVVVENELPGAALDGIAPVEAFCLRWTGLRADRQGNVPLLAATCEVRYASDGSSGAGGMDRGRALAAMDDELFAALKTAPRASAGQMVSEAVAGLATVTVTGTNIFWGELAYAPAVMRGERMERTATIEVYGYGS
jgi:hypothetical protein